MNYLPQGSNPSTAGFSCNSCGIRFSSAEMQRQHMKTDWHRYNLKRRVADLPGISSETFAEKVLESQKHTENELFNEDELGFHVHHRRKTGKGERQMTKKDLKNLSRNQTRGRLSGQEISTDFVRSHSPTVSIVSELSGFSLGDSVDLSEIESSVDTNSEFNLSEDSEWSHIHETEEEISDTDTDTDDVYSDNDVIPIYPNYHCFYCGKKSREIEQNIKHMTNYHGLYIPERSYLVDLDGLLTFINEVVTTDHDCLVCGFEGKSLESIRQHLTSKGHCKIPYETPEAKDVIAEFYNFDTNDRKSFRINGFKQTKKVAFHSVSEESDYKIVDAEGLTNEESKNAVLPDGTRIARRTVVRYHKPRQSVAKHWSESEKTVAFVDRRLAPGLTTNQVTKQEKEMRKLEVGVKNLQVRRTKSAKVNFQRHFRDEMLGHG